MGLGGVRVRGGEGGGVESMLTKLRVKETSIDHTVDPKICL